MELLKLSRVKPNSRDEEHGDVSSVTLKSKLSMVHGQITNLAT